MNDDPDPPALPLPAVKGRSDGISAQATTGKDKPVPETEFDLPAKSSPSVRDDHNEGGFSGAGQHQKETSQ
ncbi:MAG TPA: hypothetical protein VHM91_18310 [Verrucomicrobiales bacterium]|jgi:hypothetical protein|nr:hypothetical protein [Verrucomicrobiales bacterium]